MTPKSHNLWFEVVPQLAYLGRFFHFMEDPVEKLHKLDRLTDAVYCHIRNYQFREECKQKQEATAIVNDSLLPPSSCVTLVCLAGSC